MTKVRSTWQCCCYLLHKARNKGKHPAINFDPGWLQWGLSLTISSCETRASKTHYGFRKTLSLLSHKQILKITTVTHTNFGDNKSSAHTTKVNDERTPFSRYKNLDSTYIFSTACRTLKFMPNLHWCNTLQIISPLWWHMQRLNMTVLLDKRYCTLH